MLVGAFPTGQGAGGNSHRAVAGVGVNMPAQIRRRGFLLTADQLVGGRGAGVGVDVPGIRNQTASRFCVPVNAVAVIRMHMARRLRHGAAQRGDLLIAGVGVAMPRVVRQRADQIPRSVIAQVGMLMPIRCRDTAGDAAIRRAACVRMLVGPEGALQELGRRFARLALFLRAGQIQRVAGRSVGMLNMAAVNLRLKRKARKHQDIGSHHRNDQRHGSNCPHQPGTIAPPREIFLCADENFLTHRASASLLNSIAECVICISFVSMSVQQAEFVQRPYPENQLAEHLLLRNRSDDHAPAVL